MLEAERSKVSSIADQNSVDDTEIAYFYDITVVFIIAGPFFFSLHLGTRLPGSSAFA